MSPPQDYVHLNTNQKNLIFCTGSIMKPIASQPDSPWKSVFDALRQPVCILDPEGRILNYNRAMADLLGQPAGSILGRSCCHLLHGQDGPPPDCPVKRLRKTLQPETLILDVKGRTRHLTADPLLDDRGNLAGVVHQVIDHPSDKPGNNRDAFQRLQRQVFRDREVESRRIHHSLSEAIIEPLSGLKIDLQSLARIEPEPFAEDVLAESIRTVDRIGREAGRLGETLRPPLLDDLGLLPALRFFADQQARQRRIAIEMHGRSDAERLEPHLEMACFQLLREVLGRFLSSCRTEAVSVSIETHPNHLEIRLIGSCPGGEPPAFPEGPLTGPDAGLTDFRETLDLVRGTLETRSLPDENVMFRILIPRDDENPGPP